MQFPIWLVAGLTFITAGKGTSLNKKTLHQATGNSSQIAAIATDTKSGISYLEYEHANLRFISGTQQKNFAFPEAPFAAVIAPRAQFAATISKGKSAKGNLLNFAVLNIKTGEMNSFALENFYDEPRPELALNYDGSAVIGRVPQNSLTILNSSGQQVNTIELFASNQYAFERSLKVAFAADGQSFYAAAMCLPAHPGNQLVQQNVRLVKFNLLGDEIWHLEFPEQALGGLQVDHRGGKLALYTYDAFTANGIKHATRIISSAGTILAKLDTGFRDAQFSRQGEILLISHKYRVAVYESASAKMLAQKKVQAPSMVVSAVADKNGANFTMLTGVSKFENGRFIFVNNFLQKVSTDGEIRAKAALEKDLARETKLYPGESGKIILADSRHIEQIEWLAEK